MGAAAEAKINQPPLASVEIKKQEATEKLQHRIRARYPHLSAVQAYIYILKLKQSNNGVLSGLSLQEIFRGVEQLMSQDGQGQESECSICMEIMRPRAPNVRRLPCSHSFHSNCINVSKL